MIIKWLSSLFDRKERIPIEQLIPMPPVKPCKFDSIECITRTVIDELMNHPENWEVTRYDILSHKKRSTMFLSVSTIEELAYVGCAGNWFSNNQKRRIYGAVVHWRSYHDTKRLREQFPECFS